MANYFTLLTPTGLAKITNAQLTEGKVEIARIAIGDSNGINYKPTGTETKLKNEKWRGAVATTAVDPNNPNWIVVEAVVPASVGGFTLREVALYDVAGDIIAIGNYPDTYKPVEADGSTMDLVLRTIIEVSNASTVTLKVDPNVIIASRKYVDDKVAGAVGNTAQKVTELQTTVATHTATDASTAQKGHVKLSSSTTSASETEAATPKAVKTVSDALTTHLADYVDHVGYVIDSGTANAKVVALNPAPASYVEGMAIAFKNKVQNTGAVTINVNGLGAKSIVKSNGNALASGNLKVNSVYTLRYNGINFILQGEGGEYGTANAPDVRLGKTFGTENGVLNGALDLSKLIPSNIRKDVTIDGVLGTLDVSSLGGKNWKDGVQTFTIPSITQNPGTFDIYWNLGFTPNKVAVLCEFAELGGGYGASFYDIQNNISSSVRGHGGVYFLSVTNNLLKINVSSGGMSVQGRLTVRWYVYD